jgi:hypothetical protein
VSCRLLVFAPAAELQEHVDRLGAERVATILGLTLDHLGPLLAGRVECANTSLRRAEPGRRRQ